MTILEVFELLFTEIRFENPITTPTKRLNTRKAEVIEEDEVKRKAGRKGLLFLAWIYFLHLFRFSC